MLAIIRNKNLEKGRALIKTGGCQKTVANKALGMNKHLPFENPSYYKRIPLRGNKKTSILKMYDFLEMIPF